jgi:N-acetylglucosamine-6-phosphate deacetylase
MTENVTLTVPGFVDLQVNGFAGVDYNSALTPLGDIERSLEVIRKTGVLRLLPTVITGPRSGMMAALRNLARARRELPNGAMIAGFHVEGPHISPEDGPRGAHLLESVRPPDFAEFEDWQEATGERILLVTLSPHWAEAPPYIERVKKAGATVSIGHTHATTQQIHAAVEAGATMSTHLGNGAHRTLPKFPNYIWEQLAEDRLTAGFIADGIHLPDQFLRPAVRAKSPGRSILVTDASSPAGAAPGRYHLGGQAVDLTEDGRVVLAGQDRLAGSALKMNDAIAHVIRVAGISLHEALHMATAQPARAVGLSENSGSVLLNWDGHHIRVLETEL